MKNFILWFFAWSSLILSDGVFGAYFGKSLGKLSEFHHGVSGHVYAVDGRTLFIKDFTYDGEGPAAFFYVGNSKSPNNVGAQRLRDERGSAGVLRKYRGRDITLTLPEGKTFHSIRWFSVWCDEFSVNFGDVKIPRNMDFPKPQKISGLSGVHGVSSDPIVIVDAQTLLIPNFSYDGEAPDAKFWVGRGDKPSPQGIRIPDENGKEVPLRLYDHKTIVLTLPQDLTVFDIGHFGVWCEAFTVDFGHIRIPEITNVPPSLKMLGVSPQSKLNCEVLYDDLAFEVRWAVAGESVVVQLVAKLEDGEYMSFGISGDDTHSQMVGSDVTVAWVDKSTLKGYAFDYYLDAKSQCAGTRGSCPDERIAEKTNSVRLLNAAMVNGYSIVTYQRPLKAADELDRAVVSDKPQPVVWAIGPLNSRKEVSYHTHFPKDDRFLDFGRPPTWNCPMPEMDDVGSEEVKKQSGGKPATTNNGQYLVETTNGGINRGNNKFSSDNADSDISETTGYREQATRRTNSGGRPVPTPKPAPKGNAWVIPPIECNEPEDGVFYAQMGPTGGKQGYPAITGHVGWGISWYINGLLIPELNLVRGKEYTFVVEAGEDEDIPARYHPFYITDDPVGGYQHKTPEERAKISIYAGVKINRKGDVMPSGVGRSCNWTPDIDGPPADEFSSFGAYQRSLTLKCDVGNPGIVTWTPDRNTPDTVYYQCFTHRYLGWKINILDSCDDYAQASEKHEVFESPDEDMSVSDDLLSRPSIRVATRIKPDNNFLLEQQRESAKIQGVKQATKNLENHNLNGPTDSRVNIREIGRKPSNHDVINGEPIANTFSTNSKNVSPESNPRPDYDLPITKNQFKQVLDSVENYETNMRNQQDERHPVYHHNNPNEKEGNTNPNEQGGMQDRPGRNNEDFLMEMKNVHNQMGLSSNQKPMTLQTFMRPHGKPMMGNNMFFRRPNPMDMRIRRPGMQKPIIGMPPRLPPPPPFIMGQPNFMSHKKPIYKMPGMMNRPQMNGFGRPPINLPNKHIMNNGMTPKPLYSQTTPKTTPQSIILGKPNLMSQTLTLGQPTIIGQQIVRSQMILPSGGDSTPQQTQQNGPHTYLNKPGQIIMGKPMDSPMPLDQQMIQTKQHISFSNIHFSTPKPVNNKVEIIKPVQEVESSSKGSNGVQVITPSELINNSSYTTETITMRPAVNTGFKPDSVVIEGGFKPIIREPLLSGEDRITDYDSDSVTNNRRVDVDTSGPERENEGSNQLLNNEFYEKQLTESFEPMFIPSPPDRHMQIKNITIPRGENKGVQYVDIRPRPVYVKPSEKGTESGKESEKLMNKKPNDDMAMAADRVDAYYLPPEQKSKPMPNHPVAVDLPAGTVVSYDGHKVSDSTLTTPSQKNAVGKIYSAKVSSNSEQLTKTPQFGPFKGEIPSALEGQLGSRPVTKLQTVSNSHSYPGSLGPAFSTKDKSTHLSLISSLFGDDTKSFLGDLVYEASENKEEVSDDDDDESKDEIESDDDSNDRVRRSAHHTPDHTDYPMLNNNSMHDDHSMHDHSMHDHSMHDHSMHDHSQHNHSDHDHSMHGHGDLMKASAAVTNTISLQIMVLIPFCALIGLKFV